MGIGCNFNFIVIHNKSFSHMVKVGIMWSFSPDLRAIANKILCIRRVDKQVLPTFGIGIIDFFTVAKRIK